MTLIAFVSADRSAVSKPFATSSAEKPSRCVIRGSTLIFFASNKLRHRGYCKQQNSIQVDMHGIVSQ